MSFCSRLSPDRTVDYLRMMASGQIMNFGWREGISPEDARSYFEEAKNWRWPPAI